MRATNKITDLAQLVANIFTSIGVIIALIVLLIEIKDANEANQFDTFVKLLDQYDNLVSARKDRFHKIAEVVRANPNLKHEMPDHQNSLSYLLLRLNQKEQFYAVEHELLDLEIKCMSFLNELSGIALENSRAKQILLLKEANEISYYQSKLQDLLTLYHSQKE